MTKNQKIYNLMQLRQKQPFRVCYGTATYKTSWLYFDIDNYYNFSNTYSRPSLDEINLREILDSEIVIEFDDTIFKGTREEFKQQVSKPAITQTIANLKKDSIPFKLFDHGGKSPHLHIQNLPIGQLPKKQLKLFKETFTRHYVPLEFHKYTDFSLCGIKMIAVEFENHFKGCYGVKELIES